MRYWRLVGIQTPSGTLDLTALSLFDGTTSYAAPVLSETLGPTFAVTWDLGASTNVTEIRLTGNTAANFPTAMWLQRSTDGANWVRSVQLNLIEFPGAGVQRTIVNGDPHFANVSLLLKMEGADGGTTFTDQSPSARTPSDVNLVTTETEFAAYGSSSAFGSSIASRLTFASSTDFAWTGDCTLEFWLYIPGTVVEGLFMAADAARYLTLGPNRVISAVNYFNDATPALATGQWHHIALTRSAAGTGRFWVNGVGRPPVSAGNWPASAPLGIFNVPTRPDLPSAANVYIDEVRFTRGVQRYIADFTPEEHLAFGLTGITTPPVLATTLSNPVPFIPPTAPIGEELLAPRTTLAPGAQIAGTYYGGLHRIVGTVKEKNTPFNTPLGRRVVLLDRRANLEVQTVWSDPTTGAYEFRGIAPSTTALSYTIVSYDHTGLYRAVIADEVPTEPMP